MPEDPGSILILALAGLDTSGRARRPSRVEALAGSTGHFPCKNEIQIRGAISAREGSWHRYVRRGSEGQGVTSHGMLPDPSFAGLSSQPEGGGCPLRPVLAFPQSWSERGPQHPP